MPTDPRRDRRRRRLFPLLAGLATLILAAVAALALIPASEPTGSARPGGASGDDGDAGAPAPAPAPPTPRAPTAGAVDSDAGADPGQRPTLDREPIRWRRSVAVGDPAAGSLKRGVMLPAGGRSWVSWDPITKRRPSREWRRWGTDRLVRTTLRVMREFGADHPRAPRVAIGDLSRPRGGDFGPQFGFIGHASHQNGLDIDVYYPRTDRRVRPPNRASQVDVRLAQDLVDRYVRAGAEKVFVGPNLPLVGPPGVVVPLVNHDNHLHARLPAD